MNDEFGIMETLRRTRWHLVYLQMNISNGDIYERLMRPCIYCRKHECIGTCETGLKAMKQIGLKLKPNYKAYSH